MYQIGRGSWHCSTWLGVWPPLPLDSGCGVGVAWSSLSSSSLPPCLPLLSCSLFSTMEWYSLSW